MKQLSLILIASILPISAIAQTSNIKEKSLSRAYQDSIVNKATSGSTQYVNPILKSTPRQNAANDQYDCDSTCLSMGGNRTYTRSFIENKTERCPTGYQAPTGQSFIVTATRNVINNYNGNTLTGTNYGSWESVSNNLSCQKEEKQTADCGPSYTGYVEQVRTVYYNGSYSNSGWKTIASHCVYIEPPPSESSNYGTPGGIFFYDPNQTTQSYPNGLGGTTTVYNGVDMVSGSVTNMYVSTNSSGQTTTTITYPTGTVRYP